MKRRGRPRHPDVLTPREWEVLALLRQGRSNDDIANRLGISLGGAKYHVSEILGKLDVSTREDAAAWSGRKATGGLFSIFTLHRLAGATGAASGAVAVVAVGVVLVWALVNSAPADGTSVDTSLDIGLPLGDIPICTDRAPTVDGWCRTSDTDPNSIPRGYVGIGVPIALHGRPARCVWKGPLSARGLINRVCVGYSTEPFDLVDSPVPDGLHPDVVARRALYLGHFRNPLGSEVPGIAVAAADLGKIKQRLLSGEPMLANTSVLVRVRAENWPELAAGQRVNVLDQFLGDWHAIAFDGVVLNVTFDGEIGTVELSIGVAHMKRLASIEGIQRTYRLE